jgi:hypothetical protein
MTGAQDPIWTEFWGMLPKLRAPNLWQLRDASFAVLFHAFQIHEWARPPFLTIFVEAVESDKPSVADLVTIASNFGSLSVPYPMLTGDALLTVSKFAFRTFRTGRLLTEDELTIRPKDEADIKLIHELARFLGFDLETAVRAVIREPTATAVLVELCCEEVTDVNQG